MAESKDVVRLQEEVLVLQGMLANQVIDYSKVKAESSLAQKELQALSAYCDELEVKNGKLAAEKLADSKAHALEIEKLSATKF